MIPPAPYLTGKGCCSDCKVEHVLAGGGDLKICPQCHALLWHTDWATEERRIKQAAAQAAATAAAQAKRIRQQAKEAKEAIPLVPGVKDLDDLVDRVITEISLLKTEQ
jgi:hypothetical protein